MPNLLTLPRPKEKAYEHRTLGRRLNTERLRFPFKVSKVTQVVIAQGEISCIVDFYSYALKAPSVANLSKGVEGLSPKAYRQSLGTKAPYKI